MESGFFETDQSADGSERPPVIAPSVLSSDFTRLGEECDSVLQAGADWLHVDVMDGHYVPNLTIGLPVIRALRRRFPDTVLDVHIMVENPDEVAEDYVRAGADILSFHPEAATHTHRVIQSIHEAGARASAALNPATPVEVLEYVADALDMALIMSVNPGFSGQSFIEKTHEKLRRARKCFSDWNRPTMPLEVDGGVKVANIADIRASGADVFVSGSGVFSADDYGERMASMRRELESSEMV